MKTRVIVAAVVALIALAALAVACGGDGIDALAAAEIGLGVTLGLLALGGLALAFAGRKK